MTKKTEKKENTKANNEEPQKTKLGFVEPTIPTIYINNAQFMASNYDAALLVGEIAGLSVDKTLQVVPRVKLIMSHAFAKELLKLLERNIEAMEQTTTDADSNESVH